MYFSILIVFLASAFLSCSLIFFFIPFLTKYFPDAPNHRSSHLRLVPRAGGIVFVIIVGIVSLLFVSTAKGIDCLTAIALPLAVIGLLDDHIHLSPAVRYVAQLLTAVALFLLSPLSFPLPWLTIPLVLIAVTSVINFINFMDGLDGLVAGCMTVAISTSAFLLPASWSIWALVGALIGFLVWNWSPARVFMGDVGSTFLGAVFAGLVLQASSWSHALGMLLVATPLLGDASLCVARRLFAGQRLFQAHRLHLYQRLHQAGWSHATVSSLYIAASFLLALALLIGGLPWVLGLAAAEVLAGLWLDKREAVPFSIASRS